MARELPRATGMDAEFHAWPRRPSLFWASGAFLLSAAGLIVVRLLSQGLLLLFPALNGAAVSGCASILYEALFLMLPCLLLLRDRPGVEYAFRLRLPSPRTLGLVAAAAVAGVFFLNALGTLWLLLIETLGGAISPSGQSGPLALSLLVAGLLPGVAEELFFRGAVLGAWERRGSARAIVISAMLFASLHGSIEGLPAQLIVGLALGLIVVATDSLYAAMLYHALHNSLLLLLDYFVPAGPALDAYGSFFDYLGGAAGAAAIGAQALFAGLLYGALLVAIRYGGKARRAPGRDASPLDWRCAVLVSAGIVTVLCVYLMDFIRIAGWL